MNFALPWRVFFDVFTAALDWGKAAACYLHFSPLLFSLPPPFRGATAFADPFP